MDHLIEFSITNFRGIVSLHATPNGNSVTLRGANGTGKSSAIDGLWFGLGGNLDGEIVRNGADKAEVVIRFGDYLITREQKRGGKPTLTVKSADGKSTFNSPSGLLAWFAQAIQRQTFSTMKSADQAKTLRWLAPGCDTTELDALHASLFAERTNANSDAKTLAAQAGGVIVPEAPASVPDDIDVVMIAGKKVEAERQRSVNAETRRLHQGNMDAVTSWKRDVDVTRRALADAEECLRAAEFRLATSADRVASLMDPDTSTIDTELTEAKKVNAERAVQRQLFRDAVAATVQKKKLEAAAQIKKEQADALTKQLDEITAKKQAQLAAAQLPIDGLAIDGDTVTLNGVELAAVNTAARMKLDVAIAAALGHKLVAVRDASLLDDQAELAAFAHERGVRLITEIVAKGEALSAEIVDAEAAIAS